MTGTRDSTSGPRDEPLAPSAGTGTSRRIRVLVIVVLVLVQGVVAYVTFVLGLVWGGWTYALANLVTVGAFVALLLGVRASSTGRLLRLLAIPVACAAATTGLYALGTTLEKAAACDDRAQEAVAGLRDPAGGPVTFEGSYEGECLARPDYVGPRSVEYRHYVDQLQADGWRVVEEDAPSYALLTRRDVRVSIEVLPRERISLLSVSAD